MKWLLDKGYKKFYLLGSNYMFPRTANLIIVKYLEKYGNGAEVVAEQYTDLGWTRYEKVVQNIIKAKPDVILSTINGDSNTNFYKELAAQGITAGDVDKPRASENQIPVVAVSIGEHELRDLNPAEVKGHLAVASYFQSVATPSNKALVKEFKRRYGQDRITYAEVASAYAQVYLWKLAVEKVRSTSTDDVRKALRAGISFDSPEGKIRIDPKTQHMTKYFRLGRIRDDRQFDIIYESPQAIEPDPYPQVAFPGRHCDWTK
jgi:urea transport system substrate-binding protein